MLLDYLATGGVLAMNPAASVRGPTYVVKRGKTPVPTAEQARQFLDSIRTSATLVTQFAAAIRDKRYIQSHTLDAALNAQLAAPRGMGGPFDGNTEVWWDSLDDLYAAAATAEGQAAMEQLIADEREFVNLARSFVFMTEEHVIFDRTNAREPA